MTMPVPNINFPAIRNPIVATNELLQAMLDEQRKTNALLRQISASLAAKETGD